MTPTIFIEWALAIMAFFALLSLLIGAVYCFYKALEEL